MLNPLISIIVPCYNQAQYLDECLQSVLEQTYENWECIIVDDGSADNTEELVERWTTEDSRFSYYKKENGGVATARNLGLELSKGDWILPLDGDDKIEKTYLQLAAEKINEGYDFVYCRAKYFEAETKEFILPDYSFKNLLKSNIIFCSAIFSKQKLGAVRYDEEMHEGLEDWDFWISYLSKDNINVIKLNEILFHYRIKSASRNHLINNDENKMNKTKMYVLNKHYEIYFKTFGDLFELLAKLSSLKKENAHYRRIISSKKYVMINKIMRFLNKFNL